MRHPCVLRGPQQRGQNQKWLHWGQGPKYGYAAQKNITKNFGTNSLLPSKNTLKTPPRTILQKGGVSPHGIIFVSILPLLARNP